MQKWEYLRVADSGGEYYLTDNFGTSKTRKASNDNSVSFINTLGKQGWEMINFQQMEGMHVVVYHFKRQIE